MERSIGRHQTLVTKIWHHGRGSDTSSQRCSASGTKLKNRTTLNKISIDLSGRCLRQDIH